MEHLPSARDRDDRGAPSILFDGEAEAPPDPDEGGTLTTLADLNLDQVFAAMTAGREAHALERVYRTPLRDSAAVRYRQDVLRDLDRADVMRCARAFVHGMEAMRAAQQQAHTLSYPLQQQRWLLDATGVYCHTLRSLSDDFASLPLRSRGLQRLRDYVTAYAASAAFGDLAAQQQRVSRALDEVAYCVQIAGNRVRVTRYEREEDYSAHVGAVFAKFRNGSRRDYLVKLPDSLRMNHVEARILDYVTRLIPEPFILLNDFCGRYSNPVDPVVSAFERDLQFYLAYLDFIAPLQAAGLAFCYPALRDFASEMLVRDGFDVALAPKMVSEHSTVVRNDVQLRGPERILVVTGPNQGGKTTFARMIGQLHYLAALGLKVPAADASLSMPDRVLTHFERAESLATLRGKLEDELVRACGILGQATARSVVIINEGFTSTTLADALYLGREMMQRITGLGCLAVYVTFVDELASLGENVVSLVAEVDRANPTHRTFKLVRRPADGLAYATAIAEKYRLTYSQVKERIAT